MMKIADISLLERCALWQGGELQITHRYCGGITVDDALGKMWALERCDDRTRGEDELLHALRKTISAQAASAS